MGVASSYKLLSLLTPFTYTIQRVYIVHTAHIVYFVYTACTVYAVYTTYTTDTAYIAFTVHTAYTGLTALEQKKLLCLYVIWLYIISIARIVSSVGQVLLKLSVV